ncbi:MAG: sigma-70 family RNA polymerase sigma factor [Patescibacteria group bacterium]
MAFNDTIRNQNALYSFSMIDGEKDIIERAIKGEAEAFGLLYDSYQPQIYRFIYLKVSHREEAEDLTHQVFLNAWQKINNYAFRGFPFSSWLYQIARNQVIDHYRVKKIVINIEEDDVADTKTETVADLIDKNLGVEKIRTIIGRLNPSHQDVIILRFIEDFSPKETAQILGRSETAVKLLQHRAIKNLKKILNVS